MIVAISVVWNTKSTATYGSDVTEASAVMYPAFELKYAIPVPSHGAPKSSPYVNWPAGPKNRCDDPAPAMSRLYVVPSAPDNGQYRRNPVDDSVNALSPVSAGSVPCPSRRRNPAASNRTYGSYFVFHRGLSAASS